MSEQYWMRDKTVLAGVGNSVFSRTVVKSNLVLAADALKAALDDAGLAKSDVDGVVNLLGEPSGIDVDGLVNGLGIDSRFTTQTWTHSRLIATAVQHAAMAVAAGLASVVAVFCVSGYLKPRGQANRTSEALRSHGGPHGEAPHYGILTTMGGAALATRRYAELYGLTPEQLGAIPIAFRKHAQLNPNATMREPLTMDQYLSSRLLVDPLRLFDVGPNTEGACCILVTTRDRGERLRKAPVFIAGFQGMAMGPAEFVFSRPGLGVLQQPASDYAAPRDQLCYRMAGVGVGEIDAFYTFDPFSPLVLFALERFGFCAAGEAGSFVQSGRIEVGGELPINTNGGLLSEAHVSGANAIVEMVRQLRGECGERQVAGAEVLQWGNCFGDALLLRR